MHYLTCRTGAYNTRMKRAEKRYFKGRLILVSEYDSIEGLTVKGNVLWYDGNVTAKLTYPGS